MRVLIVWALLWTTMAVAQPFPNRPLRIVVPFAVGGSPDVIARGLAAQLDPQLGKSVIVDNRAGANGIIGAEIVAKAAPDGHTLILLSSMHWCTKICLTTSCAISFPSRISAIPAAI